MKVVNIKKEKCSVYIGRAGHGQSGYWGNPAKKDSPCPICKQVHRNGGETLPCYEIYLARRLKEDQTFRERFKELKEDSILGCFCKPAPCHGDVMIKYWNSISTKRV